MQLYGRHASGVLRWQLNGAKSPKQHKLREKFRRSWGARQVFCSELEADASTSWVSQSVIASKVWQSLREEGIVPHADESANPEEQPQDEGNGVPFQAKLDEGSAPPVQEVVRQPP
jgi:hypothetical protein